MFRQRSNSTNKCELKIPFLNACEYERLNNALCKEESVLLPRFEDYYQTMIALAKDSRSVRLVSVFFLDIERHCSKNLVRPSLTSLEVVTMSK